MAWSEWKKFGGGGIKFDKLYVVNGIDMIIPIDNITKIYCSSSTSTANNVSVFFRNGETSELLQIGMLKDYHATNPLDITKCNGYGEYTHLWITGSGTITILDFTIE